MNLKWFGACGVIFVLFAPLVLHTMKPNAGVPVVAEAAQKRLIRDSVLASGALIYENEAQLSPEVIGRVVSLMVKEGDYVEKGQVVVRIDDSSFRASVEQQQAALLAQSQNVARQRFNAHNERQQLGRATQLRASGFMSNANFDSAQFAAQAADSDLRSSELGVQQARAVLKQSNQILTRTVIRAPISGTVVAVSIKPGETAVPSAIGIPGSSLVTIADRESLSVDLNTDEADVARVHQDQIASIECPALPKTQLRGRIRAIALAPRQGRGSFGSPDGSASRAYSVKVSIANPPPALRPGMTCRAKIFTTDPAPAVSIPVQAVLTNRSDDIDGVSTPSKGDLDASSFVFTVSNGVANKKTVTLGIADNVYQQVLSGLAPGDVVITGPYKVLSTLADGDRVDLGPGGKVSK